MRGEHPHLQELISCGGATQRRGKGGGGVAVSLANSWWGPSITYARCEVGRWWEGARDLAVYWKRKPSEPTHDSARPAVRDAGAEGRRTSPGADTSIAAAALLSFTHAHWHLASTAELEEEYKKDDGETEDVDDKLASFRESRPFRLFFSAVGWPATLPPSARS